jgi:hypothetical protein
MYKYRLIAVMLSTFVVLILSIIGIAKLSNPLASEDSIKPIAFTGHADNLRNKRYCEVLYGSRTFYYLEIKVFSTEGINDCPENLWNGVSSDAILKKEDASFVMLNGPRFWAMDQIKGINSQSSEVQFNNLGMRQRATLSISPLSQIFQSRFYSPRVINRITQFVYLAGSNIYELISPQGEIYVMQSYTQMVDKNLSEKDLLTLGKKLSLPKGWQYRVVTTSSDLVLSATGSAHVIQDNFYNTYQRQ